MTYGLSIARQLNNFLYALGFGLIVGIFYTLTVSVRKMFSTKDRAVIAQDIIFSIAVSFACFVFMQVYSDGVVRPELIVAHIGGFFIYYFTLGRLLEKYLSALCLAVRRVIGLVLSPLTFILKKIKELMKKLKGKINLAALKNKEKRGKTASADKKISKRKKKFQENNETDLKNGMKSV